ncbi:MAG: LysE family transporter [Candidatus Aegiribacteria sp.]|nr:LysE family transporter [Candidatus Aegiribacteria sp.]
MWAFLGYATILGLSAGVSPGPLLAIVITQTVRYNVREGIKIAVAPLITDIPIICIALFLFHYSDESNFVLGVISFIGAAFVFVLGINSIRQKPVNLELSGEEPRSYIKGVLVNAFSPHPYIFWFSVGVPTIIKASKQSLAVSFAFVLCFFFFVVGSKIVIALLVGRSRGFLSGSAYLWTMRILGMFLIGFAIILLMEGISLTGIILNIF